MELTLDAMRPSDRQAYDEWKETFINEQIGIYDDTSDAAVAVAVCDAFIGDRSAPEAALCGVTGKPLFILNYTSPFRWLPKSERPLRAYAPQSNLCSPRDCG